MAQQVMMNMQFAWIPPGTLSRDGFIVTISKGFYMGVYPVTQAQFKAVMGYNPAHFSGDENSPVEMVNWFDAQDFCKKLSELTGKPIRLPTEAEWEYACRAGNNQFHSGGGEEALHKAGWYFRNSNGTTHPVGQLSPNAFGLYDMHGNVWEWCQDWHASYPKENLTDPKGPDKGDTRVLRGGCCTDYMDQCMAAVRLCRGPGDRYNQFTSSVLGYIAHYYGFRVCFRPD